MVANFSGAVPHSDLLSFWELPKKWVVFSKLKMCFLTGEPVGRMENEGGLGVLNPVPKLLLRIRIEILHKL